MTRCDPEVLPLRSVWKRLNPFPSHVHPVENPQVSGARVFRDPRSSSNDVGAPYHQSQYESTLIRNSQPHDHTARQVFPKGQKNELVVILFSDTAAGGTWGVGYSHSDLDSSIGTRKAKDRNRILRSRHPAPSFISLFLPPLHASRPVMLCGSDTDSAFRKRLGVVR